VDDKVCVEDGNSKPPQRGSGCALSHTDRAGKTENDQRDGTNVATIAALKSVVTCTGAPNQASKPGRP